MKSEANIQSDLPSEGIRTALSLALIVHLFIVFVAIASNFRPVSPLRAQLRQVPLVRPYLQALHMDLAYNYHLSFASPSDFDHRLVIDLDPSLGEEPIVLPAEDVGKGIRRQRYFQLLRSMSENVDNDAREGILPRAVAAGLLSQRGVQKGTHRLRLQYDHPPAPPDSVAFTDVEPGYRNEYDANLIFFGGDLGLVGRAPAAEVAPVIQAP